MLLNSKKEWREWIPFDKHVEISFRQCLTFCEHRQLKGWQQHFQPSVAKNSISTIVHCFLALCYMETWGRLLQDATTNPWRPQTKKIQKVQSKLHCDRHVLLASSEDSKFWVQKIYGEKSFESITDSQLKH